MTSPEYLYGIAPVLQALLHQRRKIHQLFVNDKSGSPRVKEIINLARKREIPLEKRNPHQLGNLVNTKMHQNVALACSELETHDLGTFIDQIYGEKKNLLVALDQLEDPQNVGAILRTAAFLGARGLITLARNAAPLSATVSKASAGAMEYFPIIVVNNLSECLQQLKKTGFLITGASSTDSLDYRELSQSEATVLVLGNEGQGLRNLTKRRCDYLIHIPGRQETESLNVSAASAILMQHLLN
jgi:23S rRNA (guanosine2251-2'-O)-methyltransferase